MNWKQWMKAVIQYKNTNKSDADKYLEFQTWCEKIQLDGEFDITSVEKDLKNSHFGV